MVLYDATKREELIWIARALENELSIIGLSAHLMAVATKDI